MLSVLIFRCDNERPFTKSVSFVIHTKVFTDEVNDVKNFLGSPCV